MKSCCFPRQRSPTTLKQRELCQRKLRNGDDASPRTDDQEDFAVVELLKSCANNKDLHRGTLLHSDVVKRGLLERNPFIASSLINMYAKCGMIAKAHQILDDLPDRNEVSWSTIIAGYVQQGQGYRALDCFDQMINEGISPDAVTFTCVLKACGSTGALDKGKCVHEEIASRGWLEKDTVLATALVGMYAKCGVLTRAQEVHDAIPIRNVISWNALITGYVEQGHGHEASNCFLQMQRDGLLPDLVTFISILKAFSLVGDIYKGKEIHVEISERRLMREQIVLGNALVDMYVKCGMLETAQKVHDEVPVRDLVSWNIMIGGYELQGKCYNAFKCYNQMQSEGHFPDAITFVCILGVCCSTKAVNKGKQMHTAAAQSGWLAKDIALGTALIDMYAKCGMLTKAQRILDEIPVRNIVCWSALISGYAQYGYLSEMLILLDQMLMEGFSPDEVIFDCILKANASIRTMVTDKQIHNSLTSRRCFEETNFIGIADYESQMSSKVHNDNFFQVSMGYNSLNNKENTFKTFSTGEICSSTLWTLHTHGNQDLDRYDVGIQDEGLFKKSPFMENKLINMYVKQGMLIKARKVFDKLPVRNLVSWNSLITGYAKQSEGEQALKCFEEMQQEGFSPNAVTFTCILKACGNIASIQKGKHIHDKIVSSGLLENDTVLCTALMDMYAKCGLIPKAEEKLFQLHIRDAVAWNVLIAAYARCGRGCEALSCFERMLNEGVSRDAVTLTCTLLACGVIGAINKGKQIHNEILNRDLLGKENMELCNALVDMYAKCGVPTKAKQVLDELPVRNVVSWNALITGYAQQRLCDEVLEAVKEMQKEGISPDVITFTCILKVCSQTRQLKEAQMYFENISAKYGIPPNSEHYTCMVYMFGCAGHFDRAISLLKTMPSSDYSPVWIALLSACKRWGNFKLGKSVFTQFKG